MGLATLCGSCATSLTSKSASRHCLNLHQVSIQSRHRRRSTSARTALRTSCNAQPTTGKAADSNCSRRAVLGGLLAGVSYVSICNRPAAAQEQPAAQSTAGLEGTGKASQEVAPGTSVPPTLEQADTATQPGSAGSAAEQQPQSQQAQQAEPQQQASPEGATEPGSAGAEDPGLPTTSTAPSAPDATQQPAPGPKAPSTPDKGKPAAPTDEADRRRRKKGRIRELQELRTELAAKEGVLLSKEEELLDRDQTVAVLREELDLERKLRGLLTKEKEKAEEEAALAMGLCAGGSMLP